MGICGMALTLGSVPIYRWKKYAVTTLLPSGYTPVEYIRSSGTQYINTGFIPNNNTRAVIDFIYRGGDAVFCAYHSTGTRSFGLQYTASGWFVYYGTSSGSSGIAAASGTRYTVDINKNVATINGKSKTYSPNTFTCPTPIWIGALLNGSAAGFYSTIDVYSCQIYDNGQLVRDFVPCKNASAAAGLYDLVSGVFYPNNGAGTFAAGAESENIVVADFIEEVKSLNSNAYPDGGVQDGYYYERVV